MTDQTKMIVMTVGLVIAVAALVVFVVRDNALQTKDHDHDDGAASPNAESDGSSAS